MSTAGLVRVRGEDDSGPRVGFPFKRPRVFGRRRFPKGCGPRQHHPIGAEYYEEEVIVLSRDDDDDEDPSIENHSEYGSQKSSDSSIGENTGDQGSDGSVNQQVDPSSSDEDECESRRLDSDYDEEEEEDPQSDGGLFGPCFDSSEEEDESEIEF